MRYGTGAVLPGASVHVSGPNLPGVRLPASDSNGRFRFPALPPGPYTVRAELSGFRAAENLVTVPLDATATADFALEPSASEQVVVSGEAPLIDATSTTTGTNYTSNVITHLPVAPQLRRHREGRTPASRRTGATRRGARSPSRSTARPRPRTSGSSTASTRPTSSRASRARPSTTSSSRRSRSRPAATRPSTAGRSAASSTSSPSRAATSSTATSSSTTTRRAPRREKQFKPGDSGIAQMRVADGERFDYGVDLGGFLLKDRLWFFGAYNRVSLKATCRGFSRRRTSRRDGPVSARRDGQSLLGKADLEPGGLDDGRRDGLRGPLDDLGRGGGRPSAGSGRWPRHAAREPRPLDLVLRPGRREGPTSESG